MGTENFCSNIKILISKLNPIEDNKEIQVLKSNFQMKTHSNFPVPMNSKVNNQNNFNDIFNNLKK